MSTYVFGDIQGCYRELVALLEQINPDPSLMSCGLLVISSTEDQTTSTRSLC